MYDNIPRIKKREIFIQTSISHFMKCQKWILILFYENTNFEPSGKFYFFEKGMKKREFQGGQRAEMEKVEKDGGESLSFFICRHCPMCRQQSNFSINPNSGMVYGALVKEQG